MTTEVFSHSENSQQSGPQYLMELQLPTTCDQSSTSDKAGDFTHRGFLSLYQEVQETEEYRLHKMSGSQGQFKDKEEHPNQLQEFPVAPVKQEPELILESDEDHDNDTHMQPQDSECVVEEGEEEVQVLEEVEAEVQVLDIDAPRQVHTLTSQVSGNRGSSYCVSEVDNSILIDSSSGAENEEELAPSDVTSQHSSKISAGDSGAASGNVRDTTATASVLCKVCIQLLVQNYCLENSPNKAQPPMHFCGICGHIFYGSPGASELHQSDPVKQYVAIAAERTPEGAILKKWLCNICHKISETEDTARTHLNGHDSLIPLSLCGIRHTCRADGDSTPPSQVDKLTHVCTKCGKTFECVRSQNCDETMACTCGICGEPFGDCHHSDSCSTPEKKPIVSEFLFNSVSKSGHLESVTCELCGNSFCDLADLSDHSCKTKDKRHACDMCKKSFSRVSTLRVHKLEHLGSSPHSCEACGKSFGWACRLKTHKCKVKNSQKSVESKPQENSSGGPQEGGASEPKKLKKIKQQEYKCEECGTVYSDRNVWKEHKELHLFKCGDCGKAFKEFEMLQDHKCKTTAGHMCQICEKMFTTSSSLRSHNFTHTQERPYACDICGKRFNRSNLMKVHRRSHTGETPHVCELCGKSFDWPCRMKNHRCFIKVSDKEYLCNNCGNMASDEKRHRCPALKVKLKKQPSKQTAQPDAEVPQSI